MDGWKEKMKAAHDMVRALCQPRGSEGSRRWVMSIPAKEDYDPDLVITSGLMAAEKQIDALIAERDELQRRLDAVVAIIKPPRLVMKPCKFSEWCETADRVNVLTPLYARALAIAEGRTE